jgi:hypothetical protein
MKKYLVMAVCMMLGAALFGCGKKSGLEGKVVDGKGKPIAGVKVIAKQVQPIKGYEQFEATTEADGGFKFNKLYPTSEYVLALYSDKWLAKGEPDKLDSGPEGQTKILPSPLELRFSTSNPEVIFDTKLGLMWAKNANIANRTLNWHEAMDWAQKLNYAGYTGWRVPTRAELSEWFWITDMFKKTAEFGFTNFQSHDYWSSTDTVCGSNYAWGILMVDACGGGNIKTGSGYVWPVRSAQ